MMRWFPSLRAYGMVIGKIKTLKLSVDIKIKKIESFVDLFPYSFFSRCL